LPAIALTGAGAASTLAQVSAIRGREAEIAVLTDALDLVESGRRAVVLIEGEAGIGKTGCWTRRSKMRGGVACRWRRAGRKSWKACDRSAL